MCAIAHNERITVKPDVWIVIGDREPSSEMYNHLGIQSVADVASSLDIFSIRVHIYLFISQQNDMLGLQTESANFQGCV